MADGLSGQDPNDFHRIDGCVDALRSALTMLKSAESSDGPALAQIMRLVRVMEDQPQHAMNRLKEALRHDAETPAPEKIRHRVLHQSGHTETSLKHLPASEREAIENAIAEEIRHRHGIACLPVQRRSRTAPPVHPLF